VPAAVNLSLQSNLNSSRNSKMTDSKTTKHKLPPRAIQADVMQQSREDFLVGDIHARKEAALNSTRDKLIENVIL